MWKALMAELRVLHLHASPKSEFSVLQKLTKAYKAAAEATRGDFPSIGQDKTK